MSDECLVCTKRVYPMEKIAIDGKNFHKTCFKCAHCKSTLKWVINYYRKIWYKKNLDK